MGAPQFIESQMLVDALDRAIGAHEVNSPRGKFRRRQQGIASIKWLFGDEGCTVDAMGGFRLRRTNFLVQALDPTVREDAGLGPRPFGRRRNLKGRAMLTLSKLLLENGLPDLPVLLIEPHRNHRGIWRIKFSYETGEPFSMAATQASIMVSRLHEIGEVELAEEIDGAMTIAARYATM